MTSVVAKLVAVHNQHSGRFAAPKPSATGKVVLAPDAVTITAEDWQELRMARSQAIESNSDFSLESKQLADEMRAFEDKLDTAMMKADPGMAPLITKFEAGRRSQAMLVNSSF